MNNSIFNGCGDCNKGGVSSQWSNVTSGGSTLDIFTPVANVAIGTTNPSGTRLYVSGNAYVSSNLTVLGNLYASNIYGTITGNIIGNSNVFGNLGLINGDTFMSNVFIGDLTVSGNIFSSNVFGTHTGNIVGNSNVFGNLGLINGDTSISNVLVGDLAVSGNLFTSNVFGTHTGNIVGNSNVFGNLWSSGNIFSASYFIGDGSKLTGIVSSASVQWSNVSSGGSTLDIFSPVANVAIGTTNPSGTRLYVSGNAYISSNLTVGGNLKVLGDTSISNVLVGDLAVSGNIFSSNVFGTHTGNIVGNSNVFGNLGLINGDTFVSNVLVGDLTVSGNIFASNIVGTQFGPVNTSNIFGALTGNIIGNSNVFGNLGLITGDTSISNVLVGDLTISGNIFSSNVFGTHTGNIVGNSNVFGNLGLITGDTSVSNVLIGDLSISGNIFSSNVFGSHTGNIVGNSNVFGNLGLVSGDTFVSNVLVGDLTVSGNLFASNIVGAQFGPINTSNIFGTLTGNIIGNSNVFGNLGLITGDTSVSNVLLGDLSISGNVFSSNVFGSHTGNIVGNSNVFGNLGLITGDTSVSNVLLGDLSISGNVFSSNVFGSHTGNIVGNSNVFGNLGLINGDTSVSNVLVGDLTISGNLAIGGSLSFFGLPATVGGALSDETTTLTTSNKISIRAPFPFSIRPGTVPLFSLNQLPTVTTPCIFDIGVGTTGTSIYSTRPQITSTSTSNVSATSGVPGTLTGTIFVPQYSIITANVFQVGSGTPTGAKFVIYCL